MKVAPCSTWTNKTKKTPKEIEITVKTTVESAKKSIALRNGFHIFRKHYRIDAKDCIFKIK